MDKINFVNNSAPYLSAENMNQLQTNIENEFNSLYDLYVKYNHYTSNVNLNDYKHFGIFYFYDNCTNAPVNYFYCIVMGLGGDCVQIGMGLANENLYVRRHVNGSWGQWRTI